MKDAIKSEGSFYEILTPDQLQDLEQSGCFEAQPGVKLPFIEAEEPCHYWLGEGLFLHVDTTDSGNGVYQFCAVRGSHEDYFRTAKAETAWQKGEAVYSRKS